MVKDVPGNAKSEQVSISVNGNRVVLHANFLVEPDAALEPGMKVTFSGLSLRATDDEGTLAKWVMSESMTVDVFGGLNQKPVQTKLTVDTTLSNLSQTGPADMELQKPLAVLVLDQFGNPVAPGVKVMFQLENSVNQGALRTDAGSTTSRIEALTDARGVAAAYWRLPKEAGTYSMQVSIGELTPVKFTAVATEWIKSIVTSALPTTAVISTELPAFTVKLYNQADKIWQKEGRVAVTTGSGSGKVRDILMTPDLAVPSLDAKTDVNGNLSLVWTLGTTVGNQQLTIAVPGSAIYKVFTVAATAVVVPVPGQ